MRSEVGKGLRGVLVASLLGSALLTAVVPSALPATAVEGAAARTFSTPALAQGSARFVDGATRDLLGRASTRADLDRWTPALDRGQPRSEFAGSVARSPEWGSVVVIDLYAQVFDRAPDPGGLAYWSALIAAGHPTPALAGLLYASPEFYEAAGSTTGGYVDRLYLSILHRLPDPTGRAYWITTIDAGVPRSKLAQLIFLSVEGNGQRVDVLYGRLLNRAADPAGRAYWAQILVSTDDLVLAGLLVGSPEYFAAAQQRYQSATITTLPGVTVVHGAQVVRAPVSSDDGRRWSTTVTGVAVPAVGAPMLVSAGGASGFQVGTVSEVVTEFDGSLRISLRAADLTDVLATADLRSTVELPRNAVSPPASGAVQPTCGSTGARLEVSRRFTADVAFEGHLRFDRAAGTYDVAAVVSVSSNLTSIMSSVGATSDCTWTGAAWTARWALGIAAGPVDIPLTVDLTGPSRIDGGLGGQLRSSVAVNVPCRVGFRATSATSVESAVGCDGVDGQASAEPSGGGQILDRTTVTIDAVLGTPLTGVGTSGTITPTVNTFADVNAAPWWAIDLSVSGGATGHLRLAPWAAEPSWSPARLTRLRLAQATDGIPAPVQRLTVATGWLRRGAIGQSYDMELASSGGRPAVTWSATGLPAGLTMAGNRITGTPVTEGTSTVVLTAVDSAGETAPRSVTLRIEPEGTSLAAEQIAEGDEASGILKLSSDGRYVAFATKPPDLAPGDDKRTVDLFTFDRATGVLTRLTREPRAKVRNQSADPLSISADGRYVAFDSTSPDLVAGDDNDVGDVFVWDRRTGRTTRITDFDGMSYGPDISADGNHVAFSSNPAGTTLGAGDVLLWSRDGSTTRRLTETRGIYVRLSGDASTVTFTAGDGRRHILDVSTGELTLLTDIRTVYGGTDLSADGRYVVYSWLNGLSVLDRTTGQTRDIVIPSGGTSSLPSVVAPPTITDVGGTVAYEANYRRPGGTSSDVLQWDAATGSSTTVVGLGPGNFPTISGAGGTVAYLRAPAAAGDRYVVDLLVVDLSV